MRDAVFTVSPNRQYLGIFVPTTPATTGPGNTHQKDPDKTTPNYTKTSQPSRRFRSGLECDVMRGTLQMKHEPKLISYWVYFSNTKS